MHGQSTLKILFEILISLVYLFFFLWGDTVLLSFPFTPPFKVNVFAKTKETENLS